VVPRYEVFKKRTAVVPRYEVFKKRTAVVPRYEVFKKKLRSDTKSVLGAVSEDPVFTQCTGGSKR